MLKKIVRLNMNEMPCPPPDEIIEAAQKGLSDLNRYPELEDIDRLRELLAGYSGIPKKHIILSPGSDILLREITQIFSRKRKVVMVSPSFLPTVQAAKQFATKLISIRLSPPEFDLDPEILMNELSGPSLVIIDNPNNPTGKILLDRRIVESIVKNPDILLVIDEAYYEFSRVTFADMVKDYPNLTISRSMDKCFSLAGARIGYLIAGEAFLDAFSPFYMFIPRPSLYAAIEALNNPHYMSENVDRIIKERDLILKRMRTDIQVYSSHTNFLLMKTEIPDIVRRFQDIGVLISDLSNQLSPGYIRVSIGTREENDAFIEGYLNIRNTLAF